MRSPTSPLPAAAAATTARRKGNSGRSWLAISSTQIQHLQDVKKHTIMRRTGLPARDLRVLDPMLNYPSTILGREKAIVINLEHIKAVITGTEVLVPNSISPLVEPFVAELQARVSVKEQAETFGPTGRGPLGTKVNSTVEMPEGNLGHFDLGKNEQAKVIPFEFKALEVCLESACKCLESETLTLEKEAYPALDELTSKISTLNLERVRQIKSRLVALSGRVQKVRDEIEHLLDDDMDMAEMYLTEKLTSSGVDESSFREDVDNDDSDLDGERDEDFKDESGSSRHGSYIGFKPNIEELEMLLEAYFVQIDGILNKLSTLREYVDDTEDYINIMLDEKQNQLLQMGVMLSTLTLVLTGGLVVVGIFGMNITIDLYSAPYSDFWKTTFGTLGGCVVLYILAIGWGKKSGLLQ